MSTKNQTKIYNRNCLSGINWDLFRVDRFLWWGLFQDHTFWFIGLFCGDTFWWWLLQSFFWKINSKMSICFLYSLKRTPSYYLKFCWGDKISLTLIADVLIDPLMSQVEGMKTQICFIDYNTMVTTQRLNVRGSAKIEIQNFLNVKCKLSG